MTTTVSGSSITFNDNTTQNTSAYGGGFAFRNRIINGDMRIDQRNAGASVTPASGSYTLDRWIVEASQASKFSVQQNAAAVTPPTGFTNYLGVTSLSSYAVLAGDYFLVEQRIEGFNTADLDFGKATAKTVTLSFWVRSSLTGTFGGVLQNSAGNRSYPFTYSIPTANTWTQISVTVAGDTSGTWLTTNGNGLTVYFGLGVGTTYSGTAGAWSGSLLLSATGATSVVGTNGATFYITGVQLEKGSTATSFDYRPYGQELALCQRYYYRITASTTNSLFGVGSAWSATNGYCSGTFPVTMRTRPTALEQSGTAGHYSLETAGTGRTLSVVPAYSAITNDKNWSIDTTVASGQTAGQAGLMYSLSTSAYLGWSAEL